MVSPKSRAVLGAVFLSAFASACAGDGVPRRADSLAAFASSAGNRSATGDRDATARRVLVNGIDLTGVGYDMGDPHAPIVLVNFSDFGCPFCASFARETYPALDAEFVRKGKVFFKYVPFVMGMFPNGAEAARASECAGDQGYFWQMHEHLYAGQSAWKSTRAPEPIFQRYAASAGLDTSRFAQCYASRQSDARTERATDRANRLGIRLTPTFFVNDRQVEGALPLAEFRAVLLAGAH